MLGTDYPCFPVAESIEAIALADIAPAARTQIAWRTAAQIVNRFGGWPDLIALSAVNSTAAA